MINLNDMLVFATVVKQGGFTPAAEIYGLPKSNISRKVSRLEEVLGVKLLDRSTRSQHLTEIGRLYFQHCLRIQEEVDSAGRIIETMAAKPEGTLRIMAPALAGQELIGRHLADFRKLFPEILIEMQLGRGRLDFLDDDYDLLLWEGDISGAGLEVRPLASSSSSLYASSTYLDSQPEPADPSGLEGLDCLFMVDGDIPPVWELENQQSGKVSSIRLNPVFTCDDYRVIRRIAIAGEGVARLPDYLAAKDLESGSLLSVLPDWKFRKQEYNFVYQSQKVLAPRIQVFLEYFENLYPV